MKVSKVSQESPRFGCRTKASIGYFLNRTSKPQKYSHEEFPALRAMLAMLSGPLRIDTTQFSCPVPTQRAGSMPRDPLKNGSQSPKLQLRQGLFKGIRPSCCDVGAFCPSDLVSGPLSGPAFATEQIHMPMITEWIHSLTRAPRLLNNVHIIDSLACSDTNTYRSEARCKNGFHFLDPGGPVHVRIFQS